MDEHPGYEKSEQSDNDDSRNGYKFKRINSSYGSMDIQVPQDRKSTFEPQVVKKRQRDIPDINQKIISMYTKGMTTRYQAPMEEKALDALERVTEKWSEKYLNSMRSWKQN